MNECNSNNASGLAIENKAEIAALKVDIKSVHKRIDNTDRVTEGIHKLAATMEGLTLQVKTLAEKVEESVERLEKGLKAQGERIGALEKEPGQKWKDLTKQVVSLIVAAIVGIALAKIF